MGRGEGGASTLFCIRVGGPAALGHRDGANSSERPWRTLSVERIRLGGGGVTLQPRQSAFQTDAPSERAALRPPSSSFPQIFIAIAVISSLFVLFELMRYDGMVRLDKVELTQLKREASYFNGKPEGDGQVRGASRCMTGRLRCTMGLSGWADC